MPAEFKDSDFKKVKIFFKNQYWVLSVPQLRESVPSVTRGSHHLSTLIFDRFLRPGGLWSQIYLLLNNVVFWFKRRVKWLLFIKNVHRQWGCFSGIDLKSSFAFLMWVINFIAYLTNQPKLIQSWRQNQTYKRRISTNL